MTHFGPPAGRLAGSALVLLLLVAPLGSAAGASEAAPSVTMTPTSNLADGQRTTIRASGFHPYTAIQVLACAGTAQELPKDARDCEGTTLDSSGYTDAQGKYLNAPGDPSGDTSGYRVAVLPSAEFKTVSIHCGPHDPCVLYVGEYFNDFSKPHAFIPISFRGAAAPAGSGASRTPLVIVVAGILLGLGGAVGFRRGRRPVGDRTVAAT